MMDNETKLRQQRKKSNVDTKKKPAESAEQEQTADVEEQDLKREDKQLRSWFWRPTRWVPIWLRIIIVLALIALAAAVGAMIGYAIIGDGGDMMDVFNRDTWNHIYDIIYDSI
ncbi:DNA-directed RNA polymerase subunit beta [Alkalicoccus daliensis]|uniref:DNA-directed RNA polymerase subunit beta n=1 Tax=Alkalicoccus daliensis TaxID=745820 RepID=A0A1H0GKK2_9BACI|nr:DNA-directed RNA polymerase subunit beta [Alkalicoccus daliensis]SDO07370.1 DNA-directed RNA polymerase subunit beta [Alkalicoccus daliensis]